MSYAQDERRPVEKFLVTLPTSAARADMLGMPGQYFDTAVRRAGQRMVEYPTPLSVLNAPGGNLLTALAPLMPSAAAIGHASNEWKAARDAWLKELDAQGMTEEQARAAAR